MNPTNPFRNQYALGAPPPPSYDTSISQNDHKYSDEKSNVKNKDDKSPEQFPYEDSSYQSLQGNQYHPPGGPPPANFHEGYNSSYLPDQATSSTHNFQGTQGPYPQQPLQQKSSQNGALLSWMAGYNPLEPTPAQFHRMAPPNHSYEMFSPMTLIGASHFLKDGWLALPPPAPLGIQHPFMTHDVTEEDWKRSAHSFLFCY
jgi:Domain of unknown function (DUF4646)